MAPEPQPSNDGPTARRRPKRWEWFTLFSRPAPGAPEEREQDLERVYTPKHSYRDALLAVPCDIRLEAISKPSQYGDVLTRRGVLNEVGLSPLREPGTTPMMLGGRSGSLATSGGSYVPGLEGVSRHPNEDYLRSCHAQWSTRGLPTTTPSATESRTSSRLTGRDFVATPPTALVVGNESQAGPSSSKREVGHDSVVQIPEHEFDRALLRGESAKDGRMASVTQAGSRPALKISPYSYSPSATAQGLRPALKSSPYSYSPSAPAPQSPNLSPRSRETPSKPPGGLYKAISRRTLDSEHAAPRAESPTSEAQSFVSAQQSPIVSPRSSGRPARVPGGLYNAITSRPPGKKGKERAVPLDPATIEDLKYRSQASSVSSKPKHCSKPSMSESERSDITLTDVSRNTSALSMLSDQTPVTTSVPTPAEVRTSSEKSQPADSSASEEIGEAVLKILEQLGSNGEGSKTGGKQQPTDRLSKDKAEEQEEEQNREEEKTDEESIWEDASLTFAYVG